MASDEEADTLRAALERLPVPGRRLRPRCVVSAGGVCDLAFALADPQQARRGGRAVESFLAAGGDGAQTQRRVALCSPIELLPPVATSELAATPRWRSVAPRDVGLGEGAAALGLVHGLRDDIVPPEHSTRMCEAAAAAGIPSVYRQLKREGHFEVLDPSSASWAAVRAPRPAARHLATPFALALATCTAPVPVSTPVGDCTM